MATKGLKGKELAELEFKLASYEGEDKIVSSHELAEKLKETEDSVFKISTGIKSVDRLLDEVEMGELVVVTGPTGEGKTTLLMTVTKNMADLKVSTVWFTLEVTPRQFLKKIMKSTDQLPLFYLPNKNLDNTVAWLEQRIIEAKVKYDAKVIFIDHIHSIFSLARVTNNVSLEIGDLVAKIKDMAITNNLVIFLIAHCKDDPQNSAREPRKEDIRDSGLISRLADTIMGVWRIPNRDDGTMNRRNPIDEQDNKSKIRIFKNRRTGVLGSFVMYHRDHYLSEDPFEGSGFGNNEF